MSINSEGWVGIGTTSPSPHLELNGNASSTITFVVDDVNKFQTRYIPTEDIFNIRSGADVGGWTSRLSINKESGYVGLGTDDPDAKLTVKGDIHAEEVTVDLSVPGPDYVFEEDYDLRTLEETEDYIIKNKHLPEIPSTKEIEEQGIDVGEMNMLLLKKIEELTLHQINQQNEIEILSRDKAFLQKDLESLSQRIEKLENR